MQDTYTELRDHLRGINKISSAIALLNWDQETMMPPSAGAFRAEQISLLSSLAHERATAPRLEELISACENDAELMSQPDAAANIREIRYDYDRSRKLPVELVAELSETGSLALEGWKAAREADDFSQLQPWLEKQIQLNQRKAECYGPPEGGELYDALLQDFEPGMTAAALETIFDPLRDELTVLISRIADADYSPSQAPHQVKVAIDSQKQFNAFVLERIGFDMDAGRLDVSHHPFTSGLGIGDTRLTTRYRDTEFCDSLGSTMHEAGHALYEQGLPKAAFTGQPLSEANSLGIHESQSRLWENQVGRSRQFWRWAHTEARRIMSPAIDGFSVDDLYEAVNTVQPNLIRVESDEATYNLHIMLRFDLERAMIRGELAVADLPTAWNDRMKQDLGLTVPDDASGCMQDIHWAMGAFGYFPTYSLGNLFSSQFWETIIEELPETPERIARGEFSELLGWLKKKVHVHGRRFSATQLCLDITGKPLSHRPLMRHLEGKLYAVYRITC
jgi:carboxypeptidase Taq